MVARSEETPSVLSSGESVETKLLRIAEKARTEAGFKFTSLYHLMNEELLRGCFKRLRKKAVAGIDEVTKEMYAVNLEANLSKLTEELRGGQARFNVRVAWWLVGDQGDAPYILRK